MIFKSTIFQMLNLRAAAYLGGGTLGHLTYTKSVLTIASYACEHHHGWQHSYISTLFLVWPTTTTYCVTVTNLLSHSALFLQYWPCRLCTALYTGQAVYCTVHWSGWVFQQVSEIWSYYVREAINRNTLWKYLTVGRLFLPINSLTNLERRTWFKKY